MILRIEAPHLVPIPQGSKTQVPCGRKCPVCNRSPMRLVETSDMGNKSDPKGHRLAIYRDTLVGLARAEMLTQGWSVLEGGASMNLQLIYKRPDGHTKKDGVELRKGKPLRRRFRVEGTAAGNSRLLTKSKAKETRNRHGGHIAEVIPFTPLAVRQAADLPDCKHCKVEAGKPCKSNTDKVRVPHMVRWADAAA